MTVREALRHAYEFEHELMVLTDSLPWGSQEKMAALASYHMARAISDTLRQVDE